MRTIEKLSLGLIASVGLCLSGGLYAADCLPPGDVYSETGAIVGSGGIETITNAGQGNFSCADIVSAFTGEAMEEVNIQLGQLGNPDTWTLVPGQLTEQDRPVTGVKYIFAVGGQGARCMYKYDGTQEHASSGAVQAGNNNLSATACADGEPLFATEEPTLPTTTAGEGCIGDIITEGSIFEEGDVAVVVAETLDGQKVAACTLDGVGQEFCADECRNFRDVGESLECLESVNAATGEFDLLLCQPCDTTLQVIADGGTPPLHPKTGLPMEFCWEKVNSVYEEGDLAGEPPAIEGADGTTIPRTLGTILKHTAIRQSEYSITHYNACQKTKVSVNGIDYWVTTCR